VTLPLTFRAGNLHELCGRFVAEFNRLRLAPEEIEGDEGGGGKLVMDQMDAMGWQLVRVNNGAAPRWNEHYASVAAETWFEGNQMLCRRDIILPDDNDLRGQLLDRQKKAHAKGKLAIESKADMKKRGVPSPDRADAVLGAMTPRINTQGFNLIAGRRQAGQSEWLAVPDVQHEREERVLEGIGGWVG
jgi:hypothetical protein